MLLLTFSALWLPEKALGVGHWIPLANTNQAGDGIGICLLLSDGTVMAEGSDTNWYKLTPDGNGHYVNGAWSSRNSSTWGHQQGSTAVLQNGNVFIAGGENGNGTGQVEIYNPTDDSWSTAVNPAYFGDIQDGNAMLMPDGQVLIEPQEASQDYFGLTFLFNPGNNTFSPTPGAPLHSILGVEDCIGESSWVKLPNDNVLVIDSDQSSVGATTAEMYNPNTGNWQNAVTGGTVPNIWPDVTGSKDVSEMGPAFLLPNGNAIFFGGNGVTAVYNDGFWSQSASLPDSSLGQKDAPGAMLDNGNILLAVSPQGTNSSDGDINGIGPTSFYEYDYTANGGGGGFTPAPNAPTGYAQYSGKAGDLTMLDLPDGTILLSGMGSQLWVYQPDGSPLPAGQPNINTVRWNSDGSLHLTGTLFNGISQGAAFGDDGQMDSNWPLVRFTDGSGNVTYGRTYNWSSTGVQTGSKIITTECTVPANVFTNGSAAYSLQVVANGNASSPVTFFGPVWVDFNYSPSSPQSGTFANPYSTLAQGTNAVTSGGTIAIKPGHSPVTMKIAKPMQIIAIGGSATIGH